MMKENKSWCLDLIAVLFIIFLWFSCALSGPVRAFTEETDQENRITSKEIEFSYPEEMTGFTLRLKDEYGLMIDKKVLVSKGKILLKLPSRREKLFLSLKIDETVRKESEKEEISIELILFFILLGVGLIVMSFCLGRYSNRRILKALREYIYDPDVD